MEVVELKLKILFAKHPHLIKSQDRSIYHFLIRKDINISFVIQNLYVLNVSIYDNITFSNFHRKGRKNLM